MDKSGGDREFSAADVGLELGSFKCQELMGQGQLSTWHPVQKLAVCVDLDITVGSHDVGQGKTALPVFSIFGNLGQL